MCERENEINEKKNSFLFHYVGLFFILLNHASVTECLLYLDRCHKGCNNFSLASFS